MKETGWSRQREEEKMEGKERGEWNRKDRREERVGECHDNHETRMQAKRQLLQQKHC